MSVLANSDPASELSRDSGDEFPLFCERCGYKLYGLPSIRCDCCKLHYFRCPECGSHQQINTLRPALQRGLGWFRGTTLIAVVEAKLVCFGWLLVMWGSYASMWAITWQYPYTGLFEARSLVYEGICAFITGAAGRLLVIRRRSSLRVGLIWSTVLVLAMVVAVSLRVYNLRTVLHSPWTIDYAQLTIYIAGLALIGAICALPIYKIAVRLLIPTAAGNWLLEWQDLAEPHIDAAKAARQSLSFRLASS